MYVYILYAYIVFEYFVLCSSYAYYYSNTYVLPTAMHIYFSKLTMHTNCATIRIVLLMITMRNLMVLQTTKHVYFVNKKSLQLYSEHFRSIYSEYYAYM